MLFSEQLVKELEVSFQKVAAELGTQGEELLMQLKDCNEDQKVVMKFLYGAMPFQDLADYDFNLFLEFAEHAIFLRSNMEWCKEIPERLFLNVVAHYRINSENIQNCRRFFYELLLPRIQGKTVMEAILEINYWCAENVLYKASDYRTASPITVYRSGTGRCGEESTFTVTALRSVGIPARQVYTPWWAHCDDNHAWVEVWCNGSWYFLGACEPEEGLNIGWFTKAASRALLVHSRSFSSLHQENVISKEGFLTYLEHTTLYTRTKEVKVEVRNTQGDPVEGALVQFRILNSAEYAKAAQLQTDQSGTVSLVLGIGDIQVHVGKENLWTEQILRAEEKELTVVLGSNLRKKEQWLDNWIKAPEDYLMHPVNLTEQQRDRNKLRLEQCEKLRKEKLERYSDEELAGKWNTGKEILEAARGNFREVYRFLSTNDSPYRLKLLKELAPKDYYDLKAEVLEEHLQEAMMYREGLPEDIFCSYVLSPRISYEFITPYRRFILDYFTDQQKDSFRAKPSSIWEYLDNNTYFPEDRDYDRLIVSPTGALQLNMVNEISRKVLFVAICRTLGIPARLDPADHSPQYHNGAGFEKVPAVITHPTGKATLRIGFPAENDWSYNQTWTIGRLENGDYRTLDYLNKEWGSGEAEICLEQGEYRIITANRSPVGDIGASEYYFFIQEGKSKYINLHMYQRKEQAKTTEIIVPEIVILDEQKRHLTIQNATAGNRSVFLWLEVGKEPTEHLLNELLEQQEEIEKLADRFHMILKGDKAFEHKTLSQVRNRLPGIRTYSMEPDKNIEILAGLLHTDLDKFPFIIVVNEQNQLVYSSSGYNVGSVKQILKTIRES